MNATHEAPSPTQRGDIIASGVYEGTNGLTVCWVDYVSDYLLYAISNGSKGWSTARTEALEMSDEQKQAQLSLLQNYISTKANCGLDIISGGQS